MATCSRVTLHLYHTAPYETAGAQVCRDRTMADAVDDYDVSNYTALQEMDDPTCVNGKKDASSIYFLMSMHGASIGKSLCGRINPLGQWIRHFGQSDPSLGHWCHCLTSLIATLRVRINNPYIT